MAARTPAQKKADKVYRERLADEGIRQVILRLDSETISQFDALCNSNKTSRSKMFELMLARFIR